jgi:DNA-binding transcriptional LysR family regulator
MAASGHTAQPLGAAQSVVAAMSDRSPALAHPPSWATTTPPPPGAWCRACHGTRWWTERRESHGWRCMTCHPPHHLVVEAIRREDGGTNATPQLTAWWMADVKT